MTNRKKDHSPPSGRRSRAAPVAAAGDDNVSKASDDDDDASETEEGGPDGAPIDVDVIDEPRVAARTGGARVGSSDEEELLDDGGQPATRRELVPSSKATELTAFSPSRIRDPLNRMMAEIRRHPRLSEEDERRLGRAVREQGDREAARRLVVHNLRLVMAIAHQYRRAWANILDLFQEGSVGLMEAVKRWEPMLGPRFGSYAAYWIRAYVLKFLMTHSRLIHVGNTRAGRKLFFRLERERQKLMAAGFEPTTKLLAAKLDVAEADVNEVGQHLDSREVPFDPGGGRSPRGGGDVDEGYALSERIPTQQASPEERAASDEMSDTLRAVMNDFADSLEDERERVVWKEHLAAEEPSPLGELGARFGVSKQRMGQIADKLKKRFRDQIVSRMGPEIKTDWLGEEK